MLKITLFIVCFFVTARFCKNQTGKFTVHRITSNLKYNPAWEVAPLSSKEQTEIRKILSQPFSYLSKGVQSFVFASEDGQYVIKFFRHDHLSPPFWRSKKETRHHKDFLSYKIAYESLRQETGVVFLHLNKSDFNQTLDLVDKIGIHHPIPLGRYEFLVQKRASLLYNALDEMIQARRLDDAKETLTKLVHLLAHRSQLGIFDKDPDLNTNFGVIGTDPLQIDVGRFRKISPKLDKNEIIRITDHLHQHLMQRCPELDEHLKTQIEKL
ncbi:MAG: hypothetical protein JSS10_07800 [Verrucomicrobia bacterium]|nr:hypothetical protein [Verrucomicrobiota bacterium]